MHVTSSTNSSSRHEKDDIILQKKRSDFLIRNFFSVFSSFTSKMKNVIFLIGCTCFYSASSVQFNFVENDDNYKIAPELVVSEIIFK